MENLYRHIIDSDSALIWFIDLEMNCIYMNYKWIHFSGRILQEELGKGWKNNIHPDDLTQFIQLYKQSIAKKTAFFIRYRIQQISGEWLNVHTDAIPYYDDKGEIYGYIGRSHEINKPENWESNKNNSYFRIMIEKAPDGIVLVNIIGEISYVSPEALKIFGYSADDYPFPNPSNSTHPDDLPGVLEVLSDIIQNPEFIRTISYRFRHKSGEWHWLESTFRNQFAEPTIRAIIINFRDITERKQKEEKINILTRSVEQSPVSIVITNSEGIIEYVNPKTVEITGYSLEELIGQNPRILKSGYKTQKEYEDLWNKLKNGLNWRGEFLNKKKNNDLYWEEAVISPVLNQSGKITHYVAVKEDVTEKKKLLLSLIQAKEKAEESDRLKTSFLANMSHEIRTPLNSILGFSELLCSPDFDNEEKIEFLKLIQSNGNNLLLMINDIIDISKIEAGQIEIKINSIKVKNLLTEIHKEYKFKSKEKGLVFHLDSRNLNEEFTLETDEVKLKQIIYNILLNAFKFTEKGSIKIGFEVKDQFGIFSVIDTGIGIPEEFHELIFDRFRQVDNSLTRKYQGAGLGLAISKKFVEILGGQIWVESKSGIGSTFYFSIPMKTIP